MDAAMLVLTIVGVMFGIVAAVFAALAYVVAKDPNPWKIERLDDGWYSITRTGLLAAKIVAIDVPHEGPPTSVSHASGDLSNFRFTRGAKQQFRYPIPMRGRDLYVDSARWKRKNRISKQLHQWTTVLD
jgi:hypothetical protein